MMKEQEGNNKSQQQPRSKENPQEAVELIKRETQKLRGELLPNNLMGIVSTYLLLVTAIIGFGVLAFYTGHKVTQEICFYISIPLLIVIPIALIWYLLPARQAKSTGDSSAKRKFLIELGQSRFGMFIERHWFLANLVAIAVNAYNIAHAIITFPQHPRASLATITIFTFVCFFIIVSDILSRLRILNIEIEAITQIIEHIVLSLGRATDIDGAIIQQLTSLKNAVPERKKRKKSN